MFCCRNIPNESQKKHVRHSTPFLLALVVRIVFIFATAFRQVFHNFFKIFSERVLERRMSSQMEQPDYRPNPPRDEQA